MEELVSESEIVSLSLCSVTTEMPSFFLTGREERQTLATFGQAVTDTLWTVFVIIVAGRLLHSTWSIITCQIEEEEKAPLTELEQQSLNVTIFSADHYFECTFLPFASFKCDSRWHGGAGLGAERGLSIQDPHVRRGPTKILDCIAVDAGRGP